MPAPSRDSPTVVSGAAVPETGTLRSTQAQSTQMSELPFSRAKRLRW